MHLNVKPLTRGAVYATADQAINHIFLHGVFAQHWDDGRAFGHKIDDMRRVNTAIKARDFAAFKASQRKGYWRVELA